MKQMLATLFLVILGGGVCAQSPSINEELIEAAQRNDAAVVKALLKKGADANAKNAQGATPLFYACDRGNAEMTKALLGAGADPEVRDPLFKSTPLAFAISRDHAEVVTLLLEKMPDKKDQVLTEAVRWNRIKTATSLLATESFKPDHLTYLLSLAETNHYDDLREKLVKAGAKPKPKPEFKIAPEQLKRYEGDFEDAGTQASLRVKDGQLICMVNGAVLTLRPIGENIFESQGQPVLLTFKVEGQQVVGLTLRSHGGELSLKKVEAK